MARMADIEHRRIGPLPEGQWVIRQPQRSQKISLGAEAPARGRLKSSFATWEEEAYHAIGPEGVPELSFICHLSANIASQGRFTVSEGQSSRERQGSSNAKALRVMDAFVGPDGDIEEIIRRYGLQTKVGGQSYLLGTESPDGILWEALSSREITRDTQKRLVRKPDGTGEGEPLDPATTYLARSWQADPQYSARPDSMVRRVLGVAREIIVLTQVVDAISKSRLSANALYLPIELELPRSDNSTESGDLTELQSFAALLMEHLSSPIFDRSSAASLVPLLLRGPADMADKIKIIDLARDLNGWAKELRDEARLRLRESVDAPPEIIMGKGGLNHWTGFNVDHDMLLRHVKPLGVKMAQFLTHSYLRPMLIIYEGMSPARAANFWLDYDISSAIARADQGSAGERLYDKVEVAGEAMRRLAGIDESDAPSAAERKIRISLELVKTNPQLFGHLIKNVPGFENEEPATPPPSAGPPPGSQHQPDPTKPGKTPSSERTGPQTGPNPEPTTAGTEASDGSIMEAIETVIAAGFQVT